MHRYGDWRGLQRSTLSFWKIQIKRSLPAAARPLYSHQCSAAHLVDKLQFGLNVQFFNLSSCAECWFLLRNLCDGVGWGLCSLLAQSGCGLTSWLPSGLMVCHKYRFMAGPKELLTCSRPISHPFLFPAGKSFTATSSAGFSYIQPQWMSQGTVWLQCSVCKPVSVLIAIHVCLKMLKVVVKKNPKHNKKMVS